jgi:PAS domain S-box-containing protein
MVEHLPDCITRYDRDLRLRYANAAARRVASLALGARPTESMPGSPRALAWETLLREVFAGGGERALDWQRPDPAGHPVWLQVHLVPELEPDGTVESVLAIGRDIGPLKEAQWETERREAYYRALIENASDMVTLLAADDTVRFVSPSVERVLGYRPEDCVGRDAYVAVHRDDHEAVRAELARATERPGEPRRLTYRFRHANGAWRVLEATVTDLLADPAVGAFVFNSRDVTERIGLEDRLRQAQKMEAIGRLAGGVAHDFNNLLTVIRANSDFLLEDLEGSDPRRGEAEEIRSAAEHATGLTRQLLAFSRRQVVQPKVLDPSGVVSHMSKMLRRLIGEDVELVLELEEGGATVLADPGQLEQVVLNLCVNAREALPGGGRVTVTSRTVTLDLGAASHLGLAPGHYVRLMVQDTGAGIPAEVIDQIFEPFFTTKESGTGLGLATVYGIVKQAGGEIAVASTPGVGTTLTIHLPTIRLAAAPTVAAPSQAAPARGAETVLVVDDDAPLRRTMRRVLESRGYRVLEAESGAAALELAAGCGEPIHLLLTDVVMPRMSGPELATRMREERPTTPVLYVSGYPDDTITHYGVLAPGATLVEKPFSVDLLARKVREALDHAA